MASMACLVLIETDDPLLLNPTEALKTVEGTQGLRQAVIDGLPNLTGVIAVMTKESAQFMCMAHQHALEASGLGDLIHRPVAPADDGA